jgi:SAM-dependent methyltransferase
MLLWFSSKHRKAELRYLSDYHDVYEAVLVGVQKSGYDHYKKYGRSEGRIWGPTDVPKNSLPRKTLSGRREFENLLQKRIGEREFSLLEIGPLNAPLIRGPKVKYFDLMNTQDLRAKAKGESLNPETVPEIDFFDPNGDLRVVNERFDMVVSSHCIEHQPDLIQHLKNVSGLMKSGGQYWMAIPDKRYCFDYFFPETRLAEIVLANFEQRMKPTKWQVIEHRALTTHNDCARHWAGDHGDIYADIRERWSEAEDYASANSNTYIDVHCWQFTPTSFAFIVKSLRNLNLIDLNLKVLYETPKSGGEFYCVLEKI